MALTHRNLGIPTENLFYLLFPFALFFLPPYSILFPFSNSKLHHCLVVEIPLENANNGSTTPPTLAIFFSNLWPLLSHANLSLLFFHSQIYNTKLFVLDTRIRILDCQFSIIKINLGVRVLFGDFLNRRVFSNYLVIWFWHLTIKRLIWICCSERVK